MVNQLHMCHISSFSLEGLGFEHAGSFRGGLDALSVGLSVQNMRRIIARYVQGRDCKHLVVSVMCGTVSHFALLNPRVNTDRIKQLEPVHTLQKRRVFISRPYL